MMRTHGAGERRAADTGTEVTLAGWVAARRDHGGVVFFDLRDSTGLVQVVVDPEQVTAASGASGPMSGSGRPSGGAIENDVHHIGREWVLQVTGPVRPRPEGTVNLDLPTGEVELGASAVVVLNRAAPPPFPLTDRGDDVDEVLRLRHRYLDLRRSSMQRNLRLRAAVNHAMREAMAAQDFVEIETPML